MSNPFAPIESRMRGMISRALVRLVDDGRKAQELQIDLFADETQDGVERLQNYGFTSVPKPGAEAMAVAVGGLRSHVVVIAVEDRRYRLKNLSEGEVALYDDLGNVVKLGRNELHIEGVSKVVVKAPVVAVDSANVTLGGAAGGARVARMGDSVQVGSATGTITGGSTRVKSL